MSNIHTLFVTQAEKTGKLGDHEIKMDFDKKPIFYVQIRDKKYRFAVDMKNNLTIRACDYEKLDIKVDDAGFPTLVIEGR